MGAAITGHEVFAPILASIQAQPQILRRADYVAALRRHDWSFEHSDDMRAIRAGRESLKGLVAERAAIDADGAIWNSVAPEGFKVGGEVAA